MEIHPFTPDDHETVAAVVEMLNTAEKVDAPFNYPCTVDEYTGMLRHGWDGEVPETYVAWVEDHVVGLLELHTSEWDNRHVTWLGLRVHPDHRRRGHGSRLLAFARDRARETGRTSIGGDGWDTSAAEPFSVGHGLPQRSSAIKRRQSLANVDRRAVDDLYREAAATAVEYELLRIVGRTPPDLLEPVAVMAAAINDAPTDDLDIEDEVFPAERIAAYEAAQEARRRKLYRVLARHKETGELAGHTVVAVEIDRPWIGDQHDTSVVRAHRGHRLGLLLKADMLRWLADEEPGLATIDTWNTESNDFMIRVNERLGYEILGRELEFQGGA